jgi:ABC-type transport system involved in multi-copper enzyme maturation permease subunit
MNFLPVIARELQVQARQPATNRLRWIAAAAVIAIWGFLMVVSSRASAPERAKITFIAISVVGLGGVMLAGVFQTADCLSEERREGTLGLLFLTDLRGYDVVFGKLASTSLHAVFALLAGLPVLALPLLMGGTTLGEFCRVALVLLVTLYLSLSVGMFISSVSRDTRGAMVGTFLVLLVLAGLMPLLWGMVAMAQSRFGWEFLLWPSPPFAYQQAFDFFYSRGRTSGFWSGIVTMLTLGTGCLTAACVLLPRIWQESGAQKPKRKDEAQSFSLAAWRPVKLQENAPFLWLATRDVRSRRGANIMFVLLLVIWFIFYFQCWSSTRMAQGVGFSAALFLAYGLHLMLKCLVAIEASRRLSEDRQSGALELLLVTPLPVRDIINGQVAGIWKVFRWQLLALTGVNIGLLWLLFGSTRMPMNGQMGVVFFLILIGGIVMLFLDTFALTRVGIWQALIQKRHARAFMGSLLRVLLPAWLAIVLMIFMGIAGRFVGGSGGVMGLILLWLIVGAFIDAIGAALAWSNLEQHFRTVVSLGGKEPAGAVEISPPKSRAMDS